MKRAAKYGYTLAQLDAVGPKSSSLGHQQMTLPDLETSSLLDNSDKRQMANTAAKNHIFVNSFIPSLENR
jgi:hypothetical protein